MDRVLEDRHIRIGRAICACAIALGRLRSCIRIPVRLSHGKGAQRAGSSLQLLQAKRLPKLRLGRAHAWDHGCGVRRLRLRLEPSHFFGGSSLPALEFGARPGGGLLGLPLGLLPNARSGGDLPIPSSTACASGRATRVSASWGPVIAHENSSPPTSTAINTTPAFVTMPPGERTFRRPRPTASSGSSERVPAA